MCKTITNFGTLCYTSIKLFRKFRKKLKLNLHRKALANM